MNEVDAQSVLDLHRRTQLPVLDCKAALTDANGDAEEALRLLHEKCRPHYDPQVPPGFWERFNSRENHRPTNDSES